MDGMVSGDGASDAVGFGPGVFGEGELVMMDGEDGFGLQIQDGVLQTFGSGVNQRPVVVILPVFEQRQIDLSKLFADALETTVIASIAADIDLATAIFNHERSPKRLIATA